MEDVHNLLPLLILCQGCLSFLYACPVSSDGKMAAYLSCPLGIIQEDQKKTQMVFAGLIMHCSSFQNYDPMYKKIHYPWIIHFDL